MRFKERGLVSSWWDGGLHNFKLTNEGKKIAKKLIDYQQIKSSYFTPLNVPRKGKIINVGGGDCEITRLVSDETRHTHFGYLASAIVGPSDNLHIRAVKGTPFVVIMDEKE